MRNTTANFYSYDSAAAEFKGLLELAFASRSACAGCFGETPRSWWQEVAPTKFSVDDFVTRATGGACELRQDQRRRRAGSPK
jgi:hypothetical protein